MAKGITLILRDIKPEYHLIPPSFYEKECYKGIITKDGCRGARRNKLFNRGRFRTIEETVVVE